MAETRQESEILVEYYHLRDIIKEQLYQNLPPLPPHFNSLGHNTPVDDMEALGGLLELVRDSDHGVPIQYLEIGSWVGTSALAMASRPNVTVHCIDHWEGSEGLEGGEHGYFTKKVEENGGSVFDVFKWNVRHKTNIYSHRGPSLDWAAAIGPLWFDIIFIDGDHRYDECKADIEAWSPHVRHGGIICGHDYTQFFPGVTKAVKECGHDASIGPVWYKRILVDDRPWMNKPAGRLGELRSTVEHRALLPDHFESLGMTTPLGDRITLAALVELVRDGDPSVPLVYLEVGSWTGSSALAVASCSNVEIHCVDHWEGQADSADYLSKLITRDRITPKQAFQIFKQNIATSWANIIAHRDCSTSVAATWQKKLDIVFLDGGHLEEEVEADVNAWLPHIRPGGILCGHDYSNTFPGVQRVVDRLVPDGVIGDIWYKRIKP